MKLTTKRLCRAGTIAALYTALTYAFTPFAFGGLQIRPAEALCLLPLFFPEAVPALLVGCALSNLPSPYFFYDVILGSLATLSAACLTYLIGKLFKKDGLRVALGGIFPVLINALVLPCIILLLSGEGGSAPSLAIAYCALAASIAVSQSLWVYGLGIPLYYTVKRLRARSKFLTE